MGIEKKNKSVIEVKPPTFEWSVLNPDSQEGNSRKEMLYWVFTNTHISVNMRGGTVKF